MTKSVANAVIEKLRRHTWFMNMEYAPLSLFSSKVDDKEKVAIAQNLSWFLRFCGRFKSSKLVDSFN